MAAPESGSQANPEHTSVAPLEKALRFDAVDGLWRKTKDVYYAHYSEDTATGEWRVDDTDVYHTEVAGAIHDYLVGSGLDENSEEFEKLGKRLRRLSFDQMFTRRWKYGDWVDDNDHSKGLKPGTSGESRVRKLQIAFTGRDLEEEARESQHRSTENGDTNSPEVSLERLEELRAAKQQAFAERMKGPVYGKKSQKLKEDYEAAEREYLDGLDATMQRAVRKMIDEGASLATVQAVVKRETENRARKDDAEQHKLFVEKSGWTGRFVERYANMSRKKRIAVGLGLSALALGTGIGIGFVAGLAGGLVGVTVATTGGAATVRGLGAFRTYQLRKAELFKTPPQPAEFSVNGTDAEQYHTQQRAFLEKRSRDSLENAEKVKKRAIQWTLGTVAVGGAVGTTMHFLSSHGWGNVLGGRVREWLQERGVTSSDAQAKNGSGVYEGAAASRGQRDDVVELYKQKAHVDLLSPGSGNGVASPEGAGGISGNFRVEKGHGLIREIREWGASKGYKINGAQATKMYQALLAERGKDGIIDVHGIVQDTYLHGSDVRISAPGIANWRAGVGADLDRMFQASASGKEITASFLQNKTVNLPPNLGASATEIASKLGVKADVVEKIIDSGGAVVKPTEGWYETFGELRKAGVLNISPEHFPALLKDIGPQLGKMHYPDGTPVAYFHRFSGEWRMYTSPLPGSLLHPDALRLVIQQGLRSRYALAA